MGNVYERVKKYRNRLHLSQEYVSKYLNVNRATYSQMENGKRKITAEEIGKLSGLFGVSADTLLGNDLESKPTILFARSFEKLDEADQAEIMNLIRFKEKMKEAREE